MSLTKQHELHARRKGRNVGLGLTLAAFVAIIMGLTVVKVTSPEFRMPAAEGANGN
ncbi:cytochrome C oxidase assembly protein [uncultured Pelagimonas sp.]|uniref:cytochrome C oxidase assembly protein n=1 Tax=uncultured Pelagimonas sp. TaxID=1618102 RepID=UPI00262098BE|nr:cytochrome C oxidase assembly protein [uncultured Pelagimonas sp.]